MERGRAYENVPLPLSTFNINSFLETYGVVLPIEIFCECIFHIDNIYIEECRKEQSDRMKQMKKPSK